MKRKSFFLAIINLLASISLQAQVGINTVTPDTTAALHIDGFQKGVLIPNMEEFNRKNVVSGTFEVKDGLLAYDPIQKALYIRNVTRKEWTVVNPFRIGHDNSGNYTDIRLLERFNTSNVYIGSNVSTIAKAKLHVAGRFYVEDTIEAAKGIKIGNNKIIRAIGPASFDNLVGDRIIAKDYMGCVKNIESDSTIKAAKGFVGYGITPKGGIMMWAGIIAGNFDATGKGIGDLDGWALCNGQTVNSIITPDLRGRFIVGAIDGIPNGSPLESNVDPSQQTDGGNNPNYKIGKDNSSNQGTNAPIGKWQHKLIIEEMPRHQHGFQDDDDSSGESNSRFDRGGTEWNDNYIMSTYAGGDKPHINLPPYYALAFIMRIK